MGSAAVARGKGAGAGWRELVASERSAWIVLGVASAAYAALALHLTDGTTFYADEVGFFQSARLDPASLLAPVNGHLMVIPRLAYATSFEIFGAAYTPLRLLQIAGVVACSLLFFAWGRRHVGNLALAPALILLFWGSSYEITLSPIGIPTIWSIAAGLGALVALDHDGRRFDACACALLTAAVLTHSVGVAFAVAAAIAVLLRGDRARCAWIPLVPLLGYGVWQLAKPSLQTGLSGVDTSLELARLAGTPEFIGNSAAAVLAGVFGLNYERSPESFVPQIADPTIGWLIAAAAVAALAIRLTRDSIPGSLWVCLTLTVALWVAYSLASSIGPERAPEEARFLYPGAVAVLLVAVAAVSGIKVSTPWIVVIGAAAALSVAVGVAQSRQGSVWLRSNGDSGRGLFTALEIARDRVDPSFVPTAGAGYLMRPFLRAGSYLDAVDGIGDPGVPIADLPGESEATRGSADATLVAALGVGLDPGRGLECRGGERVGAGAPTLIGPPGAVIEAGERSSVAIRRFATETYVALGAVRPNRPTLVAIPADRSVQPWTLLVTGAGGRPAEVCAAANG